MFDLRFNPAAVSNDGPLVAPPPPEFHASISRSFWGGGGGVSAAAAETAAWDAAAPGQGSRPPGRVSTASDWTERARAGELRAEDYAGHCVVPATDNYKFTVHLTTFVNYRSAVPGTASPTPTSRPATSASKANTGGASSSANTGRAAAAKAPSASPAAAQRPNRKEAEEAKRAAALKSAPALETAAPAAAAGGLSSSSRTGARSWASVATPAVRPSVAKAPAVAAAAAPVAPLTDEAVSTTSESTPEGSGNAARAAAGGAASAPPSASPSAASVEETKTSAASQAPSSAKASPTPVGTPFHAPMPPPDLSAAATPGGKISWAAMFTNNDTPSAAAAPLSGVKPVIAVDVPAPAAAPAKEAKKNKPDGAPAQAAVPAAAPATQQAEARPKPVSFAAALAAGRATAKGSASASPVSPSANTASPASSAASPTTAAKKAAAAAGAGVEGKAPTRERDGVVAPLEWQQEQLRLAAAARFDDGNLGFILPWNERPAGAAADKPAPSLPGMEQYPRTAGGPTLCADGREPDALRYVGGLDISFVKDTDVAVASLVILEYPSLKELHTVMDHCKMDVPYIAGYLAFREVDPLRAVIAQARAKWPEHFPQLFLVDGNGLLHYRKCGLATHLGILIDAPTIGCAKNLLNVDGLQKEAVLAAVMDAAAKADPKAPATDRAFPLVGRSGRTWGYAALTGNSLTKPIFISPGHRLSPATAMRLALAMAPYRVVEPIRQADLRSRGYVSKNFGK